MAAQWYYARDGQQAGPVSSQQLQQLAASGKLKPSDPVWREGMTSWSPASGVAGLTFAPPKAVGPPPAAATASLASDQPRKPRSCAG